MANIITGATIQIEGNPKELMKVFLQVFLARETLTKKQLYVTVELALKYSEYINGGVKEPYASKLLFSSETRKELADVIGMSVVHLNNTFKALANKNVMMLEGKTYIFNPGIVLREYLKFNFKVSDDQPRESTAGSSQENRAAQTSSEASSGHADVHDQAGSEREKASDNIPPELRVLPVTPSEAYDEVTKTGEKNEDGLPFLDTSGGTF